MPSVPDTIRLAIRSLGDADCDPSELGVAVLRLACETLAWHAPATLGADVQVDNLDEEAALDALAEHLWALRHALAQAQNSPT